MPVIDVRFETFGLNARLLRAPKPMERIHHHHEVELNYVFKGGVEYLYQWQRRMLPVRRMVVFWGSPPHSLVKVAPGSEMAWITIPISWLLQWNLPAGFMRELMDGKWVTEQRERRAPERFPFRQWVEEIESAPEKRMPAALMLELQACLLRLASQPAVRAEADEADTPPPSSGWKHVGTMARFMAEHFREEIGVDEVAREVGLHPKYAIPLFRRHYGITIRDYLQRHRIAHAQRLLITTDLKIIDVALDSGFHTLSAFYEGFTRAVKMSPRTFRMKHRVDAR